MLKIRRQKKFSKLEKYYKKFGGGEKFSSRKSYYKYKNSGIRKYFPN